MNVYTARCRGRSSLEIRRCSCFTAVEQCLASANGLLSWSPLTCIMLKRLLDHTVAQSWFLPQNAELVTCPSGIERLFPRAGKYEKGFIFIIPFFLALLKKWQGKKEKKLWSSWLKNVTCKVPSHCMHSRFIVMSYAQVNNIISKSNTASS